MMISTKGRYALRLMIDLAQQDSSSYISLKDISLRQDISIKYLEQIISLLCKSGLLQSTRGAQGGYKLSKKPEEYRVGDILRVTEGCLSPVSCLEKPENLCSRKDICPTLSFWTGLEKHIIEYVDSYTLKDLVK